jgi:hypothetical protein
MPDLIADENGGGSRLVFHDNPSTFARGLIELHRIPLTCNSSLSHVWKHPTNQGDGRPYVGLLAIFGETGEFGGLATFSYPQEDGKTALLLREVSPFPSLRFP